MKRPAPLVIFICHLSAYLVFAEAKSLSILKHDDSDTSSIIKMGFNNNNRSITPGCFSQLFPIYRRPVRTTTEATADDDEIDAAVAEGVMGQDDGGEEANVQEEAVAEEEAAAEEAT